MKKTKAFSLIEVLISTLILSIAFAGIIASFSFARAYVLRANRRLVSANLIRKVFDSLTPAVRQDEWDDSANPLHPNYIGSGFNETFDDGLHNGDYTVTDVTDPATGDVMYRQVDVTVDYEELDL